jgi:antitoxin HicB
MKQTTRDPHAPVNPDVAVRVAEIMARPYHKVIAGDTRDGFLGTVAELPGCVTAGETEAETLDLLHDAMAGWLESALSRELSIPAPSENDGEVLVIRVPDRLRRRLTERAEAEGVTSSELAAAILARGL